MVGTHQPRRKHLLFNVDISCYVMTHWQCSEVNLNCQRVTCISLMRLLRQLVSRTVARINYKNNFQLKFGGKTMSFDQRSTNIALWQI